MLIVVAPASALLRISRLFDDLILVAIIGAHILPDLEASTFHYKKKFMSKLKNRPAFNAEVAMPVCLLR
jgi:hypothetical protein